MIIRLPITEPGHRPRQVTMFSVDAIEYIVEESRSEISVHVRGRQEPVMVYREEYELVLQKLAGADQLIDLTEVMG